MNTAAPVTDFPFAQNFNFPDIFEQPPMDGDVLTALQFMTDQCLPGMLGFKLESLSREECVATVDYRKETTGLHGLMHGGTIFAAGDTLTAMMSILPGDENTKNVLTTDASIRYLRPVDAGTVTLKCKVARQDGQRVYFTCDYYNEAGKRVARSKYTYLLVS